MDWLNSVLTVYMYSKRVDYPVPVRTDRLENTGLCIKFYFTKRNAIIFKNILKKIVCKYLNR